jgi:hypothetical protein
MVEATVEDRHVRAPAPNKPFATFRILSTEQAREIRRTREEWGDSHLLMGLIYAKAGLIAEAEREFRELASANPDSVTARNLLNSVQAKRSSGGRQ